MKQFLPGTEGTNITGVHCTGDAMKYHAKLKSRAIGAHVYASLSNRVLRFFFLLIANMISNGHCRCPFTIQRKNIAEQRIGKTSRDTSASVKRAQRQKNAVENTRAKRRYACSTWRLLEVPIVALNCFFLCPEEPKIVAFWNIVWCLRYGTTVSCSLKCSVTAKLWSLISITEQ